MKAHPNVDAFVRYFLITSSSHGYRGVILQAPLYLAKYQSFGTVTARTSEYIETIK